MALLTEGGHYSLVFYKHGPPDGGRAQLRVVSMKNGPPQGSILNSFMLSNRSAGFRAVRISSAGPHTIR